MVEAPLVSVPGPHDELQILKLSLSLLWRPYCCGRLAGIGSPFVWGNLEPVTSRRQLSP